MSNLQKNRLAYKIESRNTMFGDNIEYFNTMFGDNIEYLVMFGENIEYGVQAFKVLKNLVHAEANAKAQKTGFLLLS